MDLRINRNFLAFVAALTLVLGGFAWHAIVDGKFDDIALVGRFGLWTTAIAAPPVLFDLVRFIPPRITVSSEGIRGAILSNRHINLSSDAVRTVSVSRSAGVDYLVIDTQALGDPIKIPVSIPQGSDDLAAEVSELLQLTRR